MMCSKLHIEISKKEETVRVTETLLPLPGPPYRCGDADKDGEFVTDINPP